MLAGVTPVTCDEDFLARSGGDVGLAMFAGILTVAMIGLVTKVSRITRHGDWHYVHGDLRPGSVYCLTLLAD
jgi:hypothetical protein